MKKVHASMCPCCFAETLTAQRAGNRVAHAFMLGFVAASGLQRVQTDARDEASKSGFFCSLHSRMFRELLAMIDVDQRRRQKRAS